MAILTNFGKLSPSNFELLAMRFLWRWGFYNVRRMGGTGDRGRDLTAQTIEKPLPGHEIVRSWVIQCKRWHTCPSKDRLRQGFAAAVQHRPDYYLLLGTFGITSALNDWLEAVRADYPFDIFFIGKDELARWFEFAPDVAFEFGNNVKQGAPYTDLLLNLIARVGRDIEVGPSVLVTLSLAMTICRAQRNAQITSLHLLIALGSRPDNKAGELLSRAGMSSGVLRKLINLLSVQKRANDFNVSANLLKIMQAAGDIAATKRSRRLDDLDVLSALLKERESGAVRSLLALGVDPENLATIINSTADQSTPLAFDYVGVIDPLWVESGNRKASP